MIKTYISTLSILFIFSFSNCYSQNNFKILFYNVENFFDCIDNPETNDNEFTPTGKNYWNEKKFALKKHKLAGVIDSVGKGNPHDIIGLCEIENRYVLEQLINETNLNKYNYKIIHKDSPDERGIDVALLYKNSSFTPLHTEFHTISDTFKTREILYTRGKNKFEETLHIFVNHWPSKVGGEENTVANRMLAANKLKQLTDSILRLDNKANICIMGDFNDFPDSKPIVEGLIPSSDFNSINKCELYNISLHLHNNQEGTSVYKNRWQMVDLFFVSGNLLDSTNSIYTNRQAVNIFKESFLLEKRKDMGYRPFRTFMGPIYRGGYSDHLPVEIIFSIKNNSK